MERKMGNLLTKIMELYRDSLRTDCMCMVNPEGVRELLAIYTEEYIPIEKIGRYEPEELMHKMMQQLTAVYKLETPDVGKNPDLMEVVSNVTYKDSRLYIKFKRISPVKLKRLEAGMSQKELAEATGYKKETVGRCELPSCNMAKQPPEMLEKFAKALSCEEEELL